MTTDNEPVVALTLEVGLTLADVNKWSDLALSLSFPADSPIQVDSFPTRLTVRALLLSTVSSRQRDPETGRFTSVKAAS